MGGQIRFGVPVVFGGLTLMGASPKWICAKNEE